MNTPHSWMIATALMVAAAGCGQTAEPPPPAGPTGASPTATMTGTPTTGARAEPDRAPPGLIAHEARVRAWLNEHGAPRVDPSRTARAPLQRLSLTIDDVRLTWEGALEIELVNDTGGALDELLFALPANAPVNDPRAARLVVLREVRVDDRAVTPAGGASLVRVPVELAAGATTRVSFAFAGTLPELPEPAWGDAAAPASGTTSTLGSVAASALARTADLDRVAELTAVDPHGAAMVGHREGLLLLARGWPLLIPLGTRLAAHATAADAPTFAPSHFELEVTAPAELALAASGVELGRERVDATRRRTRFVAPAVREVALVAGRELTTASERAGGVVITRLHRPAGAPAGLAVATTATRALEVYEAAFGPYPWPQLTLAEGPLAGASALAFPGLIVVNASFYAPAPPFDRADPLLAVLTRHPALREGLAFAVAHAVAHQWWGQLVGLDAARAPWLGEALAGVAALHYFDDAHARQAVRRQRELLLALPFQLARLLGAHDHPVRVPAAHLRSSAEIAAIHHGKAALWLDATRRAMSDTLYLEALRALAREYAFAVLDDRVLVAALAARAPQPEEVRRLAARWLDGAHADEDIGGLRPDLLLEYLVGDAAIQGGARELVILLGQNDQLGELLGALMGGEGGGSVDAGQLIAAVARLIGDGADPEVKRWLDIVAGAATGPPSTWAPDAIDALLGELGVPSTDRDAIRGVTDLLFKALEDPSEGPDPTDPARADDEPPH